MNKQEAIAKIREKSKGQTDYTDIYYETCEVDVCVLTVDGVEYMVPAFVGKIVLQIAEDPEKKTALVPLGKNVFRLYLLQKARFGKSRFTSLNEWGKKMLLLEKPDLFSKWESKFSPKLREKLAELVSEDERVEYEKIKERDRKSEKKAKKEFDKVGRYFFGEEA